MCMMRAYSPWSTLSRQGGTVCAPRAAWMPFHPVGNTISRGSACLAVGKHNLQLVENHVPILTPGVPMLDNPLWGQIQHPTQRIVIGKRRLVLCDLPELTVQSFDDVCRVYDFPNLRRIFKEGTQNFPIILPALNTGWILLLPCFGKDTEIVLCFLQRDCSVSQEPPATLHCSPDS